MFITFVLCEFLSAHFHTSIKLIIIPTSNNIRITHPHHAIDALSVTAGTTIPIESIIHIKLAAITQRKIKFNIGDIEMPQEWILDAQKKYQENEELAKAPRYDRFMDSWSVLPENMRFFEDDNGQVCLDLTRTHIRKVGDIYLQGVDKIIMPPVQMELGLNFPKKLLRHKGRQMVHSKPRIVE